MAFLVAAAIAFLGGDRTLGLGVGIFVGVVVAYGVAMLAGNRSVAVMPAAARGGPLARVPSSPDRTLVYVFRQGVVGRLLGIDIRLDDARVAQLVADRTVAFEVAPGRHVITAGAGGGFAAAQNRTAPSISMR